jgi:hypothetical protein
VGRCVADALAIGVKAGIESDVMPGKTFVFSPFYYCRLGHLMSFCKADSYLGHFNIKPSWTGICTFDDEHIITRNSMASNSNLINVLIL